MKKHLIETISRIADATVRLLRDEYENQPPELFPADWQAGVGLYGLLRAYESTGDQRFFDYTQYYVNRLLDQDRVSYSINGSIFFEAVLKLYEHTNEERYRTEMRYFLRWLLWSAPKCQNNCFEHSWTETHVHLTEQVWVDTLFMAGVVLADSYRFLGRADARDEALAQFAAHQNCLQDADSGLYRHLYDGHSDSYLAGALWGRGNGWMAASAVEVLDALGSDDPACAFIVESFRRQMHAVKPLQRPDGTFHTVLNDPATYPEMSATAGLGYGAMKGLRLGLLGEEYRTVGEKAVRAVFEHLKPNGVIDAVSSGTSGFINYADYNKIPIAPRLYGQALAILLLSEQLRAIEGADRLPVGHVDAPVED